MKQIKYVVAAAWTVALVAGGCTAALAADLPFAVEEIWSAEGFSEPESVLVIPGHPWLYVSNPNAKEAGYISRVATDGRVDAIRWVEGVKRPTGMAARDGQLYVVDLDSLVQIDIERGEIVARFKSATSQSLNDVDIDADGNFYLSEVEGNTLHTVVDGQVVPWLSSSKFSHPNAVLAMPDKLYIGNVADDMAAMGPGNFGSLVAVSYDRQSVNVLPETAKLGTWDGLMPYDGGFLASSPATGELWFFKDGKPYLLKTPGPGISDFGFDAEAGVIYAPMLPENRVVALQLSRP